MGQENTSELKRRIDVQAGVFLVRYALAEEVSAYPAIKVSIPPENEKDVSLVLHDKDDSRDITLWQPGSSVALKVKRAAQISIEVVPLQVDASTNATIKIDALSQGEKAHHVLGQAAGHAKQDLNLPGFRLHGHVAGRGDLEVLADEWLAGPAMPARIEGVAIYWPNKPRNIELRYSAIGPRANAATTPVVTLGNFAGTRGRALPVLGFHLELAGAGASTAQLAVEALFLGTPIISAVGDRLTLSGPSGLEPLIGLKINIEPRQADTKATGTKPADEKPQDSTAATAPARPVRVFRSKASTSTG
jgi:hypothetical protein